MHSTVEVNEAPVVGTFTVPEGPGPFPGVVALSGSQAVAAAAIPVERAAGPLLLLSGGDDGACPSTLMARMIVERMEAHGRGADVLHLDFPRCGHVVVRPWPPGEAPPMPFDNGGTEDALDAAHDVALPAVVRHLSEGG